MRYAPNALTVLRLGLAAWFPLAPEGWRVWVVLAAGLTDLLDGWLARRFGLSTWVGALLDAIADKLLTLVVLVSLGAWGELAWWQVGVLMSRDVVVGLVAAYGAQQREWDTFKRVAARWSGKITTALIFALMVAALGAPEAKVWILWPAMAASAVAAADYAWVFAGWLEDRRRRAHPASHSQPANHRSR